MTGVIEHLDGQGGIMDGADGDAADLSVARELLTRIGIDAAGVSLQRLAGGRNNRVFQVGEGASRCLFKRYFVHENDPRDRLGAEWSFANLLWQGGLRCIPQPMVADAGQHAALFEWIDGQPLLRDDINDARMGEALAFMLALQSLRSPPGAEVIQPAAEACFSIDAHVTLVARRLERLAAIESASPLHRQVAAWVHGELRARWDEQLRTLARHMHAWGLQAASALPEKYRCLSPSDFGFHNAMLRDGRLVFFDFEYAGWDDPAKLICDFFCQPQVPVPIDRFDQVAWPVIECLHAGEATVKDMERERLRFHLLLPVYQIKWCCILLNEFLPVGHARRLHADDEAATTKRMETQFDLARAMIRRIPKAAA